MKNHYKHLTIEAVQELLDVVKEENHSFTLAMAETTKYCDRNDLDAISEINRASIERHRKVFAIEKFLNDRMNELKADKQQEERDQVAKLRERARDLREKAANCGFVCDVCEKKAERLEQQANEQEGREK